MFKGHCAKCSLDLRNIRRACDEEDAAEEDTCASAGDGNWKIYVFGFLSCVPQSTVCVMLLSVARASSHLSKDGGTGGSGNTGD